MSNEGSIFKENYSTFCDSDSNSEHTLKLLVASDLNLGYEETLQRNQFDDSFTTFEEILKLAVKQQVDAILLTGNLFYNSKPSHLTMLKCTVLLRKYCLGLRDLKLQLLYNPKENEIDNEMPINFENPNFNVRLPIFCIHGSQDEPIHGDIGPLDNLSVCGLLNYIGNVSYTEVPEVFPYIFKKGNTVLALYALGYIHEQKISKLFKNGEVQFHNINKNDELEEVFNLLMLHQSRGNKPNCVKDDAFPDFFNLILWGHEHKCSVQPKKVPGKPYFISQPGSSIATSLSASEAVEKFVGILELTGTNWTMRSIKLKTVRPFVYEEIILREQKKIAKKMPRSEQVFNFLSEYIEETLIPLAKQQLTDHEFQPKIPLIKLRVIYDNPKDICDTVGLCRQFCDEVANAMEMLTWKKSRFGHSSNYEVEEDDAWTGTEDEKKWYMSVEDRLLQHFAEPENREKLRVVSVKGLNHALTQFVEKGDAKAFDAVFNYEIEKCIKYVASSDVINDETITEKIEEFCSARQDDIEHDQEIIEMLHSSMRTKYTEASLEDIQASVCTNNMTENEINIPSSSKQSYTSKSRSINRGSKSTIQNDAYNRNDLNISITTGRKRGKISNTNKNFVRPTHSNAAIPDIFNSQNLEDPLQMKNYN